MKLVNATSLAGPAQFDIAGMRVTLSAREASPPLEVDQSTTLFDVTAPGGGVYHFTFPAGRPPNQITVLGVMERIPQSVIGWESFEAVLSDAESPDTRVTFVDASPVYANVDVYLLASGAPLANATPKISHLRQGIPLSVIVQPGTYQLVITPLNQPTVLFQTQAFMVNAHEPASVILAPRSSADATPQPLIVTALDTRPLD